MSVGVSGWVGGVQRTVDVLVGLAPFGNVVLAKQFLGEILTLRDVAVGTLGRSAGAP